MKPTTLLVFVTAVGLVHGHVVPSSGQNAQLEARRLPTGAQIDEPARREEAETDTFVSGGGRRGVLEPQDDELPTRSLNKEPSERAGPKPQFSSGPGRRDDFIPEDEELARRFIEDEELARSVGAETDVYVDGPAARAPSPPEEGEELLRRAVAAPDTFTNPNSRRLSPFKGNVGRQTLKRRIRDYEVPSPVGVERAPYPDVDEDDA